MEYITTIFFINFKINFNFRRFFKKNKDYHFIIFFKITNFLSLISSYSNYFLFIFENWFFSHN